MNTKHHGYLSQAFIKTVNYQHLMPTRYTLDVDLKSAVTAWGDVENSTAREDARKVCGWWEGCHVCTSAKACQLVLIVCVAIVMRTPVHTSCCQGIAIMMACAQQEAKKLLEEKFKTGKNRWFFTKLRF